MATIQEGSITHQGTRRGQQPGPMVHELLRTETVLSRLPLHNLGKRGLADINLVRTDGQGHVTLQWEVAYSRKYGDARQLAYKLDTLVINRRLDAHDRPVPQLLKLGSLRQIAAELGCGRNTIPVKEALRQNAFTGITAYVRYTDRHGLARTLEGSFTRYAVWFVGEQLPNGSRADAVYLQFHDPYWDVLNHAPVRPLDYAYLRRLAPGAQRLYELLSYKIYAALKHKRPCATMRYGEYCMFAPQKRYVAYDGVKKQMWKLHRPHIEAGYLLPRVRFEATGDAAGSPDWLMLYTPGPQARAEYAALTRQRGAAEACSDAADAAEPLEQEVWASVPAQQKVPCEDEASRLVQAFYQRFHKIDKASPPVKAVAQAAEILAQYGQDHAHFFLEYAYQATQRCGFTPDHFGGIRSYLPHALAAFERHQEREAAQQASARSEELRAQYDDYCAAAVARLTADMAPEVRARVHQRVETRLKQEGKTPSWAMGLAVQVGLEEALIHRAGLPSFEAWCQQQGGA